MSERATIAAFGVPRDAEDDVRAVLPGLRFFPGVRAGDLYGAPPGAVMLLADGPVAAPHALGTTETLACVRRGNRIVATGGAGLCRALEIDHPGLRGTGELFDLLAPHLFVDLRWLVPELGHDGVALAELALAHGVAAGASHDELDEALALPELRAAAVVARARELQRARAVAAARTIATELAGGH